MTTDRVEAESCVDAALGEEFVERNECAVEEEVFESKDRARTTLFFLLFFFFLASVFMQREIFLRFTPSSFSLFFLLLFSSFSLLFFFFYSHLSVFTNQNAQL